jgi:predicted metalloprotease with PDZ domain
VTVLDLPSQGPNSTSVGGTGRSDAFAFFATTNARPGTLDQVMSHEMMHTWVPRRIGTMPSDNEALNYWLSEGFTDFVSWRSLVRGGLWTPQQFAAAFNEQVKAHDVLPERAAPNSAIGTGFWTSGNLQRLPYMRGMLFAHWLDLQVRQATQGKASMDDVLLRMQALASESARKVTGDQKPATAAQNLRAALREVAGLDATQGIEQHIEQGLPIALPGNIFAPCGELSTVSRPAFDRGFDVQATTQNSNIVAGTRVGSPAHRAGLRDGMRIIRRSGGEIGNSAVPLAYELQDGAHVRSLSWLPAGEGMDEFRELRIAPNLNDTQRAQCVMRLGG